MRNQPIKKYLLVAALALLSLSSNAQLKLYSRKMQLEDFPSQTLKVVMGGQSLLELTLKEEINSRWTITPFEFCSLEDYDRTKEVYGQYFLRFSTDAGVIFLEISKGGKPDDADMLKRGFEVVKIPIAAEGGSSGQEFQFMGAFVDVLQNFMGEALASDRVAYVGLPAINTWDLEGKTVILDTQKADAAMQEELPDTVAGLCIYPSNIEFKSMCYKMLVTTDTHRLMYFEKTKYQGPKDTNFTAKEERSFEKRHGVISR